MTTNRHAPTFQAAKLYRKVSASGNEYLAGRMGGVKVALLKSNDAAEDGSEIWSLMFSEAPPFKPSDGPSQKPKFQNIREAQRPKDNADESGKHHTEGIDRQSRRTQDDLNDPIPF